VPRTRHTFWTCCPPSNSPEPLHNDGKRPWPVFFLLGFLPPLPSGHLGRLVCWGWRWQSRRLWPFFAKNFCQLLPPHSEICLHRSTVQLEFQVQLFSSSSGVSLTRNRLFRGSPCWQRVFESRNDEGQWVQSQINEWELEIGAWRVRKIKKRVNSVYLTR
jgi:hypothetical protein